MRPSVRLLLLGLLLAVLVTGGAVVAGTLAADETEAPDDEPFATTALEDFDTSGLEVRRASFCSAVDPRQVEAALGAEPESEESWSNGDRITVSSGERDIVHEYGCRYTAPDGSSAAAWVFAPPVEVGRARRWATSQALGADGFCTGPVGTAPAFGEPSSMGSCLGEGTYLTSYQGLFGDAWLTCQLSLKAPSGRDQPGLLDLEDRTGRWCVGVALAASSEAAAEG